MGKTFSITIPLPLEELIATEAKREGVSRSRFIGTILRDWCESKKETSESSEIKEEDNDPTNPL